MTHTVPRLVILNPNLTYDSVIIDRVMKNHDPDLQQPERNPKNLKRKKIMKKITWDEIAAHRDRPRVTVTVVVVEKVQRNRKSRGDDQKNEVKRKIRNQEDENRDQVKDRKNMKEAMTRPAAVQVRTIGKIHLMMRKIQVWNLSWFFDQLMINNFSIR